MTKPYYITCAIPYANGEPHIGHAYEVFVGDTMARYKRLDGYDVRFQTGMDEHGQKNEQTAEKEGISTQELVDRTSAQFKKTYEDLDITFDDFIRTTEPRHKEKVQIFWQKMVDNGDIYLDKYSGWYSVRDEAYFDESELSEDENGKKIAPSGAPVEWMEEESYFFKLSKYQDKLLDLYTRNPNFITPKSRYNEVYNFVKSGLRDLSVSRTTFKWGVEVPNDDGHVMYVWVDALSNYITALDYPTGSEMKKYWPADLHVIGKDIIRFHAIYWPAFLMSAGLEVPKGVSGHGFVYNGIEKMSKSVGNVITPKDFVNTYGLDATRYFMLRDVSFGQDCSITHEAIVQRINSDLAGAFGNMAQRSLSMIAKNCDGKVPNHGDFNEDDNALLNKAYSTLQIVRSELDQQAFHKALVSIWSVISDANKYIDAQAPWKLKKTDPNRMETVLYVMAEIIRVTAILTQPFMPDATSKMLDQLSVDKDKRDFSTLNKDGALKSGTQLPKPEGVFPRFVEKEE